MSNEGREKIFKRRGFKDCDHHAIKLFLDAKNGDNYSNTCLGNEVNFFLILIVFHPSILYGS